MLPRSGPTSPSPRRINRIRASACCTVGISLPRQCGSLMEHWPTWATRGAVSCAACRRADEHALITGLSASQQDRLNSASFEVYAGASEAAGYPRPHYDAQRSATRYAVQRVREAFGERLRTLHVVADGLDDDMEVVFLDFRRETLVLPRQPRSSGHHRLRRSRTGLTCELRTSSRQPAVSATRVHARRQAESSLPLGHGGGCLDSPDAGVVSCSMRRRWAYPDGRYRVEMLLVGRDDLMQFTAANEDVELSP